ncbi:N-acetylneuraminate lyase-like isoform X1 [Trichogramma pretiosum]|uniref:N-acetylneuraminate lyase-like isoform X1 n=1 Tax=Trichogramma pretiosum TaxID=7493 RepID=UPI0006C9AB49|nr:N-acetylneuraminate lyase-like isoform X1 [Trichogramma pretiosum]
MSLFDAEQEALYRLNYSFKGLVVPVFTPFNDDGTNSLNLSVIPYYAEYLKVNNVRGVLINGTVAEGLTMTVEERKILAEAWMEESKRNGFHLIIQVGGVCLTEVRKLAMHAESIGADAILCLPDIYYRPNSVTELVEYLREVSASAPKTPLLYYHDNVMPKVSTINIGKFLESVNNRIPTLVGVKFTVSTHLDDVARAVKAADGRFTLFYGSNQIIPSVIALGVEGYMAYISNLYPEEIQRIISTSQGGDIKVARTTHNMLMKVFDGFNATGCPIAAMKAAMPILKGLDLGPCRKPLPSFCKEEHREQLRQALADLKI